MEYIEDRTQNNLKSQVINEIIVGVSYYNMEILSRLEMILIETLKDIRLEKIETLPMEMKDSIDRQNQYVVQLFQYKKKKLSTGTKYGYIRAVKRLVTLIDKPLVRMEESDIYYYLDWYEHHHIPFDGKKNEASTVNNERRFLSAFFTWMRKEKLIQENPVEAIEPLKTERKPIDYFTEEQIAQLRDGCRTVRERALIEVLRSTGARIGEIAGIERTMINWDSGDILILGEKGNRYRTLYLDPDALYYCKKYITARTDQNASLFVSVRAPYKGIGVCALREIMKKVGKRAGVSGRVYPHKMRKTLGMELKNKGVDIGTIQEVLGHADSRVTSMYYAQSTPDTLRAIRKRAA